jgi:hypothetical protein
MRPNSTRNQHYLSRIEQKLNACNPESTSGKLKIYSFRIGKPNRYELALESPRGRPIASSLSFLDLFSFDVSGGSRLRFNLESLFQRYETNIESLTDCLLKKLADGRGDIETEIVDLFAAKFLNFVRNPFCFDKVLNSFPGVETFEPTDPKLRATYRRIIFGKKPQQAYVCQQLGINDQKYTRWFCLLFMLLEPMVPGLPNLFEGVISGLLQNRKTHIAAYVGLYDEARCLLSDRGYCQTVPEGPHMGMSFNLYSQGFIEYIFAEAATLLADHVQSEFLSQALATWEQRSKSTVSVTVIRNDRNMLVRYDRRVIEFSDKRVLFGKRESRSSLTGSFPSGVVRAGHIAQ